MTEREEFQQYIVGQIKWRDDAIEIWYRGLKENQDLDRRVVSGIDDLLAMRLAWKKVQQIIGLPEVPDTKVSGKILDLILNKISLFNGTSPAGTEDFDALLVRAYRTILSKLPPTMGPR